MQEPPRQRVRGVKVQNWRLVFNQISQPFHGTLALWVLMKNKTND
jgi:hypothetical protein